MKLFEEYESLYYRFCRNMSITGKSKGTLEGYGSHLAAMALHFGRSPFEMETEDVHEYCCPQQSAMRGQSA